MQAPSPTSPTSPTARRHLAQATVRSCTQHREDMVSGWFVVKFGDGSSSSVLCLKLGSMRDRGSP